MSFSANAITIDRDESGGVAIVFSGRFSLDFPFPDAQAIVSGLTLDPGDPIAVIGRVEDGWDSALPALLYRVMNELRRRRVEGRLQGFPDGVQRLMDLAGHSPAPRPAPRAIGRLERIGQAFRRFVAGALATVDFVGALALAAWAFLTGRRRFRMVDFWLAVEKSGVDALAITAVIGLLVGMIFAFVGAVQLNQFGAGIYVANLVTIALLREMGAIMTAIVAAGRTGAAFAAEIATMQGSEEVDALFTLGVPVIEFLAFPRVLAMVLMMPLLCLYADALGLVGGALVGVTLPDVTLVAYAHQTLQAFSLSDLAIGLVKSAVFGVLVALSGCMAGMAAQRSASAVGSAATAAVVRSILFIIIADAAFAVALNAMGI